MKNYSQYNSKSSNKYGSLLFIKFHAKHFGEYKDDCLQFNMQQRKGYKNQEIISIKNEGHVKYKQILKNASGL